MTTDRDIKTVAVACYARQNGQAVSADVLAELEDYIDRLHSDLEVEIDLHGGRTVTAYNLRTLIIRTEKEIDKLTEGEA